ncbi:MAG: hypothetical protein M0Z69_12335 [Actinomycetota bacterium]|nr:hypothetical protein [Actinomycetota bacterium]
MGGLLAAWAAEMGLLAWRDVKSGSVLAGLPLPADFVFMTALFAALGTVPRSNPGAARAATYGGWAIVVATAMNAMPGAPKPKPKQSSSTPPAPTATGAGKGSYLT